MLIAFAINPVYGRDNDTIDSRYAMKKRIEKKKKKKMSDASNPRFHRGLLCTRSLSLYVVIIIMV